MRLLILSSEFPPGPGGIGTHAYQLACSFSSQGEEVLVVTSQDYASEEEISAFNARQSFAVRRLARNLQPIRKLRSWIRTFREALRVFSPDLVLSSGSRSIWLCGWVLNKKQTPWVVAGHGSEFGVGESLNSWLTRHACNRANAIICVSEYTRRRLDTFGVRRPFITVIHNGADSGFFQTQPEERIQQFRRDQGAEGRFVLLTVGNLTERKGQAEVIRALPVVLEKHPEVVYWMAGLPTQQVQLQNLAERLGVKDNIRFWGRVSMPTLLDLYNAADLFLMTSQDLPTGDFEGYGIAVIEAALCGKTSIVSRDSGLAEAVVDGVTGVLVPQGDTQVLSNRITQLIEEPEYLHRLAQAAKSRAQKSQTWDQVGRQYLDLLERIKAGG